MWFLAQNDGELEVNGLRLMGASSKRSETGKLGFFGSGWKYALAWFLRNHASVVVYVGSRRVEVGTRGAKLRGQEFDEITIDGQGIGVTTAIGPLWEAWMAVREVVTNAIDEGGATFGATDGEPSGVAGATRVYVTHEHVKHVVEAWEKYFRLEDECIEKLPTGRILKKVDATTRIYRRGILVREDARPSTFDYEVNDVKINEERLAMDADQKVWKLLDASGDSIKLTVLSEMKGYEESVCPTWETTPSLSWARLLKGKTVVTREQRAFHGNEVKNAVVLPDAWVGALKKLQDISTVERALRARSRTKGELDSRDPRRTLGPKGDVLRAALKVLAAAGIAIADEDVVLVDEFEDRGTEGTWDGQKIRALSTLSVYRMTLVLLHEWAHRESGACDRTREFEAFLDDLALRLILGKGKLR